jgi:hypothetical protein
LKAINIAKIFLVKKEEPPISKHNCPDCGDVYKEPTTEDWTKCDKSSGWWHEALGVTEGTGNYICDHC